MVHSEISVVALANGKLRSVCPAATVLSSQAEWQGVRLEQHLFPPFEQPEVRAVGHIISIHLSEPLELEYRYDGSPQRRQIIPRVCITPDGTPSACWQESAALLVLGVPGWFGVAPKSIDPDLE